MREEKCRTAVLERCENFGQVDTITAQHILPCAFLGVNFISITVCSFTNLLALSPLAFIHTQGLL
jgi:hypothetical protein